VSGVLPKPQQQTDSGDVFSLGEEFQFLAVGVHSTPMLQNAFDRYRAIIFQRRKPDGAAPALSTITGCDVNVTSDVQVKTLTTDESYELHVRAPRLFVRAATVFGALYALETFSQLVRSNLSIDGTVITDKPRFAYRGTMIDTSRHFYPVTSIKMHIDAMAYAKMNVLHWHIVDEIRRERRERL
jgi:hexosaminidase